LSIIGPSFQDELRAAGVIDFRFSVFSDGRIEFHPDVPKEERDKVLAVLAAHDGPLSEARHQALEGADAEAARRIADPFGKPPDSLRLAYAEINRTARAVQLLWKVIKGSALPEEWVELDALDAGYDRIGAIRDAEKAAKAALLGAKSVEEVEAVKPSWPKE
jgi:hypothetical protein